MVHESLGQSKDLRFNEIVPGRLLHVRVPCRNVFSRRAHVLSARLAISVEMGREPHVLVG